MQFSGGLGGRDDGGSDDGAVCGGDAVCFQFTWDHELDLVFEAERDASYFFGGDGTGDVGFGVGG